jgi:hypothetical protein
MTGVEDATELLKAVGLLVGAVGVVANAVLTAWNLVITKKAASDVIAVKHATDGLMVDRVMAAKIEGVMQERNAVAAAVVDAERKAP